MSDRKRWTRLGAMVAAMATAGAVAQDEAPSAGLEEITVTAQRRAQSLQDVPIAVSAFSAQALQAQQINNAQQLQLTLPNITFSKGNFTGSSFTIRGVADLKPQQDVEVEVTRKDGSKFTFTALCRIDTANEVEYFMNGGILHYVLRKLAA